MEKKMLALIDKFEGLVLNNSRRIISFAIFILLLGALWNLFGGIFNTIDGPNVEADDAPRMPKFEEPLAISDSKTEEENEVDGDAEEVDIVESDFARELDKLASIHAPLYVATDRFDDVDKAFDGLRNYIKGEVERLVYAGSYSDTQKEAWVDGYVDFSKDFKNYMVDKHKLNLKNPGFTKTLLREESYDSLYLDRPVEEYRKAVKDVYTKHQADAAEATVTSTANNIKGATQLMLVGIILGIVILFILILLIFKAENSLRRSADSSEKN
jgi:hypothetical protein